MMIELLRVELKKKKKKNKNKNIRVEFDENISCMSVLLS